MLFSSQYELAEKQYIFYYRFVTIKKSEMHFPSHWFILTVIAACTLYFTYGVLAVYSALLRSIPQTRVKYVIQYEEPFIMYFI